MWEVERITIMLCFCWCAQTCRNVDLRFRWFHELHHWSVLIYCYCAIQRYSIYTPTWCRSVLTDRVLSQPQWALIFTLFCVKCIDDADECQWCNYSMWWQRVNCISGYNNKYIINMSPSLTPSCCGSVLHSVAFGQNCLTGFQEICIYGWAASEGGKELRKRKEKRREFGLLVNQFWKNRLIEQISSFLPSFLPSSFPFLSPLFLYFSLPFLVLSPFFNYFIPSFLLAFPFLWTSFLRSLSPSFISILLLFSFFTPF